MPRIEFAALPDSSRVWVYGADRGLDEAGERKLLSAVDSFLDQWNAHGTPLIASRDWRDGRFLTVAVDQEQAGASGCSIDGLFRNLQSLERELDARLVPSGLVYFRDEGGEINAVTRDEFSKAAENGEVNDDTEVFDPTVTSLLEWKGRFRSRAGDSWHKSLMPGG